jgi:hypothetical protein
MSEPKNNPLEGSQAKAAREQAAEHVGFMASKIVQLDGMTIEIPNMAIMSPEQSRAYAELTLYVQETDELVRWADKVDDDGDLIKGNIKEPWRTKNGELVEDYDTRLTRALLGDKFDAAIAAGYYPSQTQIHLAEMRRAMEEREKADSKSAGSAAVVDSVPETD